jgi:hypothetical protein
MSPIKLSIRNLKEIETMVATSSRYTFSMDSFRITDTRSAHEDTDYVSISLAVGSAPPITKTKAMGNLNNGTFKVGLEFDSVSVGSDMPVVFTYAIVNNGHGSQANVEQSLQKAGTQLAQKAAEAAAKAVGAEIGSALGASIGTAAVPVVGTALGALAGWLVGEIGGFLFANCDGPVAAGVHVFKGADLASQTGGGKVLTQTDHNPGTNSPTGCGSNSNYYVSWSVKAA